MKKPLEVAPNFVALCVVVLLIVGTLRGRPNLPSWILLLAILIWIGAILVMNRGFSKNVNKDPSEDERRSSLNAFTAMALGGLPLAFFAGVGLGGGCHETALSTKLAALFVR